jgi:hypothetical protein
MFQEDPSLKHIDVELNFELFLQIMYGEELSLAKNSAMDMAQVAAKKRTLELIFF